MLSELTVATLSFALLAGADWTRFRGPGGAGVAQDTGLPTTWSASENVLWKTALPGFGGSSPITVGDKIFVTAYSGYGLDQQQPGSQDRLMLHVLCVEGTTGKILWDQQKKPRLPVTDYDGARVNLHGYASATPVSDGESLYVFFGKSGVFKYSLEGEQLWHASVGTEIDRHNWGSGASPVLHEDLLIVNASIESKSIRALNKTTGKQVWQVDGIHESWSTPLVVSPASGGKELVVIERTRVLGLDPATGEQLWLCNKPVDYVCPSVIAHEGVAFLINSRRNAMLLAIRTGGRGDITNSHVLWEKKRWTTRVSTPVYYDGHLYAIDFQGMAHCIKADNGEEVYRERLKIEGAGDKIYASLVAADGKLYGVTRLDGTIVLALAPTFKELAHNHLDDASTFNATPVVISGRLLLRSDRFLYCLGKR